MVDTFDKLLLELERCLMGTSRRQFTDEFKRESVGMLASSGRPLSQIARELGIAARHDLLCLHRRILQSSAAPFRPRVYHPRTGRAPSRLILCPLNRRKVISNVFEL